MKYLMECGHVAMAVNTKTNKPCCVICHGDPRSETIVQELPDLTNRTAVCSMCGKQVPSSLAIAYFKYRGVDSFVSKHMCKHCGFADVAHTNKPHSMCKCDKFTPKGAQETDEYYCGCRGWN